MPRPLPALALCISLCLPAGWVQAQAAQAGQASQASQEATGGDAVLQLLQQKGLLAASAAGDAAAPIVRQMRDAASDMVLSAMNFLGVPYRRGGSSADDGFDCSGFTRHVFEHSIGLVLPRRADQQAKDSALQKVQKEELKPGDLVFFNTMRRAFSHVGIYIGEGKFIHAPRAGGEVRIEDMRQAYWSRRFNGARRPDLPAARSGAAATAPALPTGAQPASLPVMKGPFLSTSVPLLEPARLP
jgi:cell wall-associated NlpC family hydrolase